jgi:3-vinyl bacteriochlorophyllide hydratase
VVDSLDCCPWGAVAGRGVLEQPRMSTRARSAPRSLYTPEQRCRRDATAWTTVRGVLAPVQFLVFLVSLGLVIHYLMTGTGEAAATASIVVKTVVLYGIMITGAIWEREVFGQYLFAPMFYWEDMVSMLVLTLHTGYLASLLTGALDTRHQMLLALAAYASYAINATQFVLKLRMARRESGIWQGPVTDALGLS